MWNTVGAPAAEPSDDFVELVRDALLRIFDLSYLQIHPLLAYAGSAESGPSTRGKRLRQAMLDAIDAMKPSSAGGGSAHAWRTYHLLELRYIEGNDVASVMDQIALSKAQYHREHNRALQAVASLLWERWGQATLAPGPAGAAEKQAVARQEVEQLASEPGGAPSSGVDPIETLRDIERLLHPMASRRGTILQLVLPQRVPAVSGERVALRQLLLLTLARLIELTNEGTVMVTMRTDRDSLAIHLASSNVDASLIASAAAAWQPFIKALHCALSLIQPNAEAEHGALGLTFPIHHASTLLVADNNADFIALIERYLRGSAWSVIGASNADEAFAVARRRRPTAILLDIVIPGRDGWELLVDLQTTPATRDIPIIVCSVLVEPEVATSLGATAYLQKPLSQDALLAVLSAVRRWQD